MSYGGKSVNSHDMRRVYVHGCGSWVCVCASRADEMKNDGCYMCQQNAYPNNKEGVHVFQPACVFNSTMPLP